MPAEVTHAHVDWQGVSCESVRRVRDEDLPAVAGRGDSCGAVHIEPDVVPIAQDALTGVKADPYADHVSFRPGVTSKAPLGLDCGTKRPCRRREGGKEGVAYGLNLGAATGSDRLSENPIVLGEETGVRLTDPLE
jgi:hypothetical protein